MISIGVGVKMIAPICGCTKRSRSISHCAGLITIDRAIIRPTETGALRGSRATIICVTWSDLCLTEMFHNAKVPFRQLIYDIRACG